MYSMFKYMKCVYVCLSEEKKVQKQAIEINKKQEYFHKSAKSYSWGKRRKRIERET